jgi:hypothetical protein
LFGGVFDKKQEYFRGGLFKYFLVISEEFLFLFGFGLKLIILLELIFKNYIEDFKRILSFITVVVDIKDIAKVISNVIGMFDLEANIGCSIVLDEAIYCE